jgi:RNA polymerase sigma factor (sigma-70 family)
VDQIANSGSGLTTAFLAHRESYRRFLGARQVPAEDAEDILQDLFVKLERLAPGPPIGEPRAYIYRMLDNLILDRRRAETRRQARDERWGSGDHLLGEEDPQPGSDETLIFREQLGLLQIALGDLPERTQRMFYLARIEDLPRKQIAAEFGVSVSAVEKHLQKAYEVIARVRAGWAEELAALRRP